MDSIARDIAILDRQLKRYFNRSLSGTDLTATELMYITFLLEHQNSTQDQLADEFGLNKSALVRPLDVLEKKGYVQRKPYEKDIRFNCLSITEEGRELKPLIEKIKVDWSSAIGSCFNRDEIEIFSRILSIAAQNSKKLNTSLGKETL